MSCTKEGGKSWTSLELKAGRFFAKERLPIKSCVLQMLLRHDMMHKSSKVALVTSRMADGRGLTCCLNHDTEYHIQNTEVVCGTEYMDLDAVECRFSSWHALLRAAPPDPHPDKAPSATAAHMPASQRHTHCSLCLACTHQAPPVGGSTELCNRFQSQTAGLQLLNSFAKNFMATVA